MGTKQTEAKNAFVAKFYDRLSIFVHKGQRDVIRDRAKMLGKSVNAYVVGLILSDLDSIEK